MSQAALHGLGRHPDRRRFLISLAALGASTAFPLASSLAQAPAKPRLIDVHHHIIPSLFVDAWKDRSRHSPASFGWSPQKARGELDQSGVATAIVSYSQPGVWLGDVQQSRSLARRCNEYAAQLARDNPGRFGFFAALPLPDTDGSLREIDYALGTLKADGIGLMTSYDDRWLGDTTFSPVFDELNRRNAVVYVHPTAPACCRSLISYVPPNLTEFIQDTNRAITSLMFSGSLGRLTGIRFVFSHAGGTIPMLSGRIAQISHRFQQLAPLVPNGVEYELKRLHYEVANSATRPAIAALTSLIPISQILFGSDYPVFPISMTAEGLSRVGLSGADVQIHPTGHARPSLRQVAGVRPRGHDPVLLAPPARSRADQVQPSEDHRAGYGLALPQRVEEGTEGVTRGRPWARLGGAAMRAHNFALQQSGARVARLVC